MKVTAFVGSARKKHTYNAAEQFLKNLQSLGGVDYEIVMLSDYNLQVCRGCKSCLDRGEELCPLVKLVGKLFDLPAVRMARRDVRSRASTGAE